MSALLCWCQIVLVPNCPVPNCPFLLCWCQIVLVPNCPVPNCPGAKLSWCQIVRCQIVRCQIVLPPMALEIDEKGPVIVIMHCIIFSTWIILRLTLKINLYGWCCCMFARNFSSNLMFSFAPSRFPTGYGDKTNTRGIFPTNYLYMSC